MPNCSRIPSLRFHKSSGQAVATIGGRDQYFGAWGPHKSRPAEEAKTAYDQAISKWLAEGRPTLWSGRSADLTVAEIMVEYIRFADARYRRPDGTSTGHIGNIKLALRPLRRLYARTFANEFNCVMVRNDYGLDEIIVRLPLDLPWRCCRSSGERADEKACVPTFADPFSNYDAVWRDQFGLALFQPGRIPETCAGRVFGFLISRLRIRD
jgi:hypothetical protein